ncbi:MAG: thioredoxin domain-containing protein [Deltaproteobacteria bacterium]|nr:thioredoxin domain-containing protein [Deltaproteobacteria bacterium]
MKPTENKNLNEPNGLIHEKSPYLLQHAHNPVDWHPWRQEAFQKAKIENKPVFLSIGYSTCHWCHVMERESFEDIGVAELMNETFVSIKVDREERPDLDHIYMTACQMLTGSGGWPLTIIMTPDKHPFFAATYIPKQTRFGRIGMMELIPRIRDVWENRRDEIKASTEKILEALYSLETSHPRTKLDQDVFHQAYHKLAERFDTMYGGFGSAPKFPTPHNLFFLLRYWKRTNDRKALQMVEKTLHKIRQGGIYDHIGFGFHRYATDKEWRVPHFEKMLYDQALLALAYMETFQATGDEFYGDTAKEIFTYVLRDMKSSQGGFFSAEDADSEGKEGKFYVWTDEELRNTLDHDEADLFMTVYDIQSNGNYRDESTGERSGTNIFHLQKDMSELAARLDLSFSELRDRLEAARQKLFKARENRIHPHKDDKILTDWNGLMIAALAKGAQVFGDRSYRVAAENAARFVLTRLRRSDGGLFHRYRDGDAGIIANLDDYALLVWGLIELYEVTFNFEYLQNAIELNDYMIEHFWDKLNGGLFFTPDNGEELIIRKKEINDGAIPSGNALAMLNLLWLALLTGDIELEGKATEIEKAFSEILRQHPSAYIHFMSAMDFMEGPAYRIIIAGDTDMEDTRAMLRAIQKRFLPNKAVLFRPVNPASPHINGLMECIKQYKSMNGQATAYVCLNQTCKAPTTNIEEMLKLLK